ncbi:MAG: hydroxymethylbilane synthase [Calditrichaeota bacterium]|nr:MAG: hydroxymethylbilane synthase [Calditrichota bacterium]
MQNKKVIIGSRGSDLALWQAHFVQDSLAKNGVETKIKIIKTQGDKIQNLSFDKLEGKGFFTKEIEDALLNSEIDLAVHSHKDLPTESPEGLKIVAVSEREDPSELLLIRKEAVDPKQHFSIKKDAIVGTSSARRKSQLLSFRNDFEIIDLRGNVPTRIQKLRDKKYDAIVLANAGVSRLGLDLSEFHQELLAPIDFIPAPAQGVLAYQIRENDSEIAEILSKIHSPETQETTEVERKILNLFEGGCQMPVGVFCQKEGDTFQVWTAKSKTGEDFPIRIFKESKTAKGLAEKIVQKFRNIQPKEVFISRDLIGDCYFENALIENDFTLKGKSLIKISRVEFEDLPKTDWIFFTSKNGVKHFFAQNPKINPKTKFAAISKGTAKALKQLEVQPDFVGSKLMTKEIGKEFAKVSKGQKVLFPLAQKSMRTIQTELIGIADFFELVVYENKPLEAFEQIDSEILVFTSPSNAESFLKSQKISSSQKVVAIGTTTAKYLNEAGISDVTISYSTNEVHLAEAVFSVSSDL